MATSIRRGFDDVEPFSAEVATGEALDDEGEGEHFSPVIPKLSAAPGETSSCEGHKDLCGASFKETPISSPRESFLIHDG